MAKKHQQQRSAQPRAQVGQGARVVGGVGVGKGAVGQAGRFSQARNGNKYSLGDRTTAAGRNLVQTNRTARAMLREGAKTKSLPAAARGLGKITKLESLRSSSGRMFDGFKRESRLSSLRFNRASSLSSRLMKEHQSVQSLAKLTDRQIALDAQRKGGDAIAEMRQAEAVARETAAIERDQNRIFGTDAERGVKGTGRGVQRSGRGASSGSGRGGQRSGRLARGARRLELRTPSSGSGAFKELVTAAVANLEQLMLRMKPGVKTAGNALDTTGYDQREKRSLTAAEAALEQARLRREPRRKSAGNALDTTGFDQREKRSLTAAEAALEQAWLRRTPGVKTVGPELDTTGYAVTERGAVTMAEAAMEQARLRREPGVKSAGPELDTTGFDQRQKGPLTLAQAALEEARLRRELADGKPKTLTVGGVAEVPEAAPMETGRGTQGVAVRNVGRSVSRGAEAVSVTMTGQGSAGAGDLGGWPMARRRAVRTGSVMHSLATLGRAFS